MFGWGDIPQPEVRGVKNVDIVMSNVFNLNKHFLFSIFLSKKKCLLYTVALSKIQYHCHPKFFACRNVKNG